MKPSSDNPRFIALNVVCSVVLDKHSLSAYPYPQDLPDLAFAKSLSFGTIRFYHQLNDVVTELLKHSLKKSDLDIHCLILLGAYQILHTNIATHAAIFETVNIADLLGKNWAKGLVNALLRKIDRDPQQTSAHYSHPTWLFKKIKQNYPDDFVQILTQNNRQAPMTIRVHPDYTAAFKVGDRIKITPQARILDKPVNVNALTDFEHGSCYVQDASAQLAGHLLNPNNTDLILDACAAPGGKTTHLSELAPRSNIIALDNNAVRLEKLQQNIKRFSIKNIALLCGNAQHQDWWDGVLFDKILLDAPCSATGVIRRHPDIKLLRKPKDITALVALQKDILNNLWTLLKPNGVLLYATCSILKAENQQQIANFLATHPDAVEQKMTLDWGIKTCVGRQQLPQSGFDGFYYAKLIKTQ